MGLIGIVFFKYMLVWIFTIAAAKIDADHYNKGEWVENKRWRWLQRASAVAMAFGFGYGWMEDNWISYEGLGYAFLFYAIFDQALNKMRDDVDFWHVGKRGLDYIFYERHLLYVITKVSCLLLAHYFLYLFISKSLML